MKQTGFTIGRHHPRRKIKIFSRRRRRNYVNFQDAAFLTDYGPKLDPGQDQ